jgi:rSAM/selenodomain-associated transferase 2
MISIIIPVYNEAEEIGKLIRYVKKQTKHHSVEIIAIDGGSSDNTIQEVITAGGLAIKSPQKGRAEQMNFGAKKAQGEWLYFLHADTYPPPDFPDAITQEICKGAECGCFRLQFDAAHPVLKFYAWFTRFNLDIFRFGDQSLFVKEALFQKIGGFREDLRVMEDQEMVRRLKKHAQFAIISKAVTTSARKYQRFGVFRLQLIFSIITALFYLRVSQEVLVHFYESFMKRSIR